MVMICWIVFVCCAGPPATRVRLLCRLAGCVESKAENERGGGPADGLAAAPSAHVVERVRRLPEGARELRLVLMNDPFRPTCGLGLGYVWLQLMQADPNHNPHPNPNPNPEPNPNPNLNPEPNPKRIAQAL